MSDHCYRAARAGCGCARCQEWRKALAEFRTERAAERRGEPIQLTMTEANR